MNGIRGITTYPRSMVFPLAAIPIGASHYVIDGAVAAHRHMFVEIAVILGGRGCHCAEHGVYNAQIGDVFVILPGVWHAYEHCQQSEIYNCYFGTELLEKELAWMRDDQSVAPLFQSPFVDRGVRNAAAQLSREGCVQYRHVLDQLVHKTQGLEANMRVECLGLLTTALGIVTQAIDRVGSAANQRLAPVHPAVAAGKHMLEERLEYPWTLVELAYQLHIDRSYLVRLFRLYTGLAPMAYLAQRRAERAAALLRTTRMPIFAIGSAVGWNDPNQFCRRFKACFGISASRYRSQACKEV